MPSAIRVVSQHLQVPVLEAPRFKPLDVSSGAAAVATGLEAVRRAQRVTEANRAQIGFARDFRALAEGVRRMPWNEQQQAFDAGVAQIRRDWIDSVRDPVVRGTLEPDFDRTLGVYAAHTAEAVFKGEAASNLLEADRAADEAAQQAATAKTPLDRDVALANGAAPYHNLVHGGYVDELQHDQLLRSFLNKVDRATVLAQLADPEHDPLGVAKTLREGAFPNLDATQRDGLLRQALAESDRRKAARVTDAAYASSETQHDVDNLIKGDLTARARTGAPADLGTQERIRTGASKQAWRNYQRAGAAADAVFRALGDLRFADEGELEEALERSRTLGTQAYAQARLTVSDIRMARMRDPGAAARSFPQVDGKWQAYEADPSPEKLQAALKSSRVAQSALGIGDAKQRFLPDDIARRFAQTVNGAEPAARAQTLRDMAVSFGPYWDRAFRQLAPLLAPAAKVSATLRDDAAAALLHDGAAGGVANARRTAGVDGTDLHRAIGRDPRFLTFAAAIAHLGDTTRGARNAAGAGTPVTEVVLDSLEHLALANMSKNGTSQRAAIDHSLDAVLGHYQTGEVNGHPIMAPDTVDMPDIESRARGLLQALDLSNADSALGGGSAALSAPYFATAPGLVGLMLYDANGPVTRNGEPIVYTWDDVAASAPSQAARSDQGAAGGGVRLALADTGIATDFTTPFAPESAYAAGGQLPTAAARQGGSPQTPASPTGQGSPTQARGQPVQAAPQRVPYNQISAAQVPPNPFITAPLPTDAPWKLSMGVDQHGNHNILVPTAKLSTTLSDYLKSLDWVNPTDGQFRLFDSKGGGRFEDMRRSGGNHWYHGSLDIMSAETEWDFEKGEMAPAQVIGSPVTGRFVRTGRSSTEGPYIELDIGGTTIPGLHIRIFHVEHSEALSFYDRTDPANPRLILQPNDIIRAGQMIGVQQTYNSPNNSLAGVPVHVHIQIMLPVSPGSQRNFLIDPTPYIPRVPLPMTLPSPSFNYVVMGARPDPSASPTTTAADEDVKSMVDRYTSGNQP